MANDIFVLETPNQKISKTDPATSPKDSSIALQSSSQQVTMYTHILYTHLYFICL